MPSLSIPDVIAAAEPYMVSIRRELHANPELSFKEHATAARITALLREITGVTHITEGVGRTGVSSMIFGEAGAGPCILLRADMDALPLQETGDLPYKSTNEGVMHACGHDGHCAALLGAARVLAAERKKMRGSIKLCFQPAEEGYGGARFMIEDGVLEASADAGTPRVDQVYGAHLWSYEALGTVGARAGPMMAGSDRFECTVTGKGGHGAAPQSTVDAIIVASHLVTALQTVVSRSVDPLEPAVVSCCQMHGGSGYNIIADEVKIGGTARHFSLETQAVIEERMVRKTLANVGRLFFP
jgi:amidohydrolase